MAKDTGWRGRGFTLPEVLVTIALIAVLAAVVVPAVASQITKGDVGKISQDLLAMRVATEQYLADVRRYPNSIGQLVTRPATSNPRLCGITGSPTCTNYTQAEVNRWRGPYLSKDSVAAVATGFGVTIRGQLDTVSFLHNEAERAASGGMRYVVVAVPAVDSASAVLIDQAMDDGVLTTGLIRWRSNATADTLKFLMLPHQ